MNLFGTYPCRNQSPPSGSVDHRASARVSWQDRPLWVSDPVESYLVGQGLLTATASLAATLSGVTQRDLSVRQGLLTAAVRRVAASTQHRIFRPVRPRGGVPSSCTAPPRTGDAGPTPARERRLPSV